MLLKKTTSILVLAFSLVSCGRNGSGTVEIDATFQTFHLLSEDLYNGDGSWGRGLSYRMALRDSYWRADVYGELEAIHEIYAERSHEVYAYLLTVQAEGGSGVFGFPADIHNPEFGNVIRQIMEKCPDCIQNGWVVHLPGNKITELYYDHGYALASLAKGYLRTKNPAYRNAILRAADWALDKPIHGNSNYLSALSKGLSHAYRATGDIRYLNRSIDLHDQGIFPNMSLDTGGALDKHNQQLEYHGFLVSGIIALKSALPENHEYNTKLDLYMTSSILHMQQRNVLEDGPYGVTWPGTNLLAWYELEQLRELTPNEMVARDRCISLLVSYKEAIAGESGFRLQKSLYSNFFLGLYGN